MHPNEIVLNELVDDTLGSAERAEVERHLTTCAECRRLVDDPRQLRRGAAALEPMRPPARTWRRIEQEIEKRGRESFRGDHGETTRDPVSSEASARKRGTAPYWLAAAAIIVLATLVGLRTGLPWRQTPATPASGETRELAQSVESELLQAEQHYQKAISGLEQIANAEKGSLDPQTAATLQKNLAVIDQAINESRAALKTQPNSEPAQQSLLESFKTKIAVLQDTVALINEMRKGNDAGAAQIVSGIKRKS